jgi:hypothetical protein
VRRQFGWAAEAFEETDERQAVTFTGNDILRVADGRFAEYWTGTSPG